MAHQREVFTILEDKTTAGLGVALKGKVVGDAVADVQMPVLPCQDNSGNEAKIPLAASGAVSVTFDIGTPVRDSDQATPSALNTDTDVAVITLTATEKYQVKVFMGSSFQPTLWKVIHDNDGTDDEIARFVTGPGDFNFQSSQEAAFEFTAGATGTQELKVVASQLRGPLSDCHASISAVDLP